MRCNACETDVHVGMDGSPTACPSCGHHLGGPAIERVSAPVDDLPAATIAPVRASRTPFVMSGFVALGAVGVATAAVLALMNDPLGNAKLADRLPAGAAVYAEVNVRGLVDGVEPLLDALAPLFPDEDVSVDALTADEGFSLSDVLPWASGRAAVSVEYDIAGLTELSFEDPPEQPVVHAIVDGRDGTALAEFLAGLETDVVGTTTVDGVDFLRLSEMWLGQVGDDLLMTSSEDEIARLLAVTSDTSVASQEGFLDAADRLPGGADLLVAIDTDPLLEGYREAFGEDAAIPTLGATPFGGGWSTTSVELSDGQIDVVTVGMGMAPSFSDSPELTAGIPGDAVAWYRPGALGGTIDLVGGMYLDSLEQATAGLPGDPGLASTTEDVLGAAGVVFARDSIVAVFPADQDDLDPSFPYGMAVLGLAEGDAAAALRTLAEAAPTVPLEPGRWSAGPFELGQRGDLSMLTTRPDLIDDRPSPSFADAQLLADARALVGDRPNLAVDIPAVVALITGMIDPDADTTSASCQPFDTLAGTARATGDDMVTIAYAVRYQRRDC